MTYISRDLEKKIISFLNSEEIIAISGARQVGKTTMIEHLLSNIKNKNITKITFDNINIKNLFVNNTEEFIEKYIKNTDVLFIDEIHYVKDSGKILKYIYDKYKKKTKIIITSSSSLDLSIQSLKYLVGRVIIFELFSFSFYEFLLAKDKKLAEMYKKANNSKDMYNLFKPYLNEYFLYGGYPKVVLEKNRDNKERILKNIVYTFALRDVISLTNLSDDFKLNNLLISLSLQIGNIINYQDLSNRSNLNYLNVKNILNIFNKTHICKQIKPFYKNKITELTKKKKIYFYDLGLRNAVIDKFLVKDVDAGFIAENFVFCELIRNEIVPKYWRTDDGAEVDFVIEKGYDLYSIEVKNDLKRDNISKSYISFIKKYSPKKGFIVTDYLKSKKKYVNTEIDFISFINIFEIIKNIK